MNLPALKMDQGVPDGTLALLGISCCDASVAPHTRESVILVLIFIPARDGGLRIMYGNRLSYTSLRCNQPLSCRQLLDGASRSN
jgi:hypothetical protein